MHHGKALHESQRGRIIDCAVCEYAHVEPLPTSEVLAWRYEDYPVTPAYLSRTLEDLAWWRMWFGRRLDRLAAISRSEVGNRRVLDVGSGLGYFLEKASTNGWEAIGVEPSVARCAHARTLGCRVFEGTLDEVAVQEELGQFDAIHASEVLEHVLDPAAMLSRFRDLLRPGGSVCVVVPNDFNPVQGMVVGSSGAAEWWVTPEHHLNYFTHRSLARLAVRCGLDVVETTSTFPIDFFLLMGDHYVGNDALGRECHRRRVKFELTVSEQNGFSWYDDLSRAFASLALGREAVLWARRPRGS